jgi:hypothetical protein
VTKKYKLKFISCMLNDDGNLSYCSFIIIKKFCV